MPFLSILREVTAHPGASVAEGTFGNTRVAVETFNSEAGCRLLMLTPLRQLT